MPANSSTFKMRSKVEEMLMFKKFSKWQNKPITRVLFQMFWILWQQFITLLIPWKFIFGQNHGLTLEWSHFFQIFTPLNCLKLELTWQQYQEKKYFIFAREKIPLSRPFCNWSTLQCVAPHPSKQRCNKGACICQQEFGHFVKLERPNSLGNWLNIEAWKGTSRLLFHRHRHSFIGTHFSHRFGPYLWVIPYYSSQLSTLQ